MEKPKPSPEQINTTLAGAISSVLLEFTEDEIEVNRESLEVFMNRVRDKLTDAFKNELKDIAQLLILLSEIYKGKYVGIDASVKRRATKLYQKILNMFPEEFSSEEGILLVNPKFTIPAE